MGGAYPDRRACPLKMLGNLLKVKGIVEDDKAALVHDRGVLLGAVPLCEIEKKSESPQMRADVGVLAAVV